MMVQPLWRRRAVADLKPMEHKLRPKQIQRKEVDHQRLQKLKNQQSLLMMNKRRLRNEGAAGPRDLRKRRQLLRLRVAVEKAEGEVGRARTRRLRERTPPPLRRSRMMKMRMRAPTSKYFDS